MNIPLRVHVHEAMTLFRELCAYPLVKMASATVSWEAPRDERVPNQRPRLPYTAPSTQLCV